MRDDIKLTPAQKIAAVEGELMFAIAALNIIKTESFVERDDDWADDLTHDELRDRLESMGDGITWRSRELIDRLTKAFFSLKQVKNTVFEGVSRDA